MPNWCECDLSVRGRAARVREFLRFAKTEELLFDFDKFIPYPERLKGADCAAGIRWVVEGYESTDKLSTAEREMAIRDRVYSPGITWRVKNWGTRWNAQPAGYGLELRQGLFTLTAVVYFNAAWTPPLPVVLKASEMFPDLKLDLCFVAFLGGYCGRYCCRHGKETLREINDLDTRPQPG